MHVLKFCLLPCSLFLILVFWIFIYFQKKICSTKYVLLAFFMKCFTKTVNSDLHSLHLA